MPQVTAISPQKKAGRYNIYLDGRFALGLDELTLAQKGVHLGQEIDKAELTQLKDEGELGKLYDKVLGFLAVRPRSEKEIRDYLARKISNLKSQISKVSEYMVDIIVNKLKDSGLVDDEKFAQWWVEQRQGAPKPKGRWVIKNELRRKGVPSEIIDGVFSRLAAVDESELARKAAAKKAKIYKKYPSREFQQKMTQYLLRQGFAWPIIKEVLKKLF